MKEPHYNNEWVASIQGWVNEKANEDGHVLEESQEHYNTGWLDSVQSEVKISTSYLLGIAKYDRDEPIEQIESIEQPNELTI